MEAVLSDDEDFQAPSTTSRRLKSARRTRTSTQGLSSSSQRSRSSIKAQQRQQSLQEALKSGGTAALAPPQPARTPHTHSKPAIASRRSDPELKHAIDGLDQSPAAAGYHEAPSAADSNRAEQHAEQLMQPTEQLMLDGPNRPCCPICSADLTLISDTEAGRAAHVNACLDAAAASPAAARGTGSTAAAIAAEHPLVLHSDDEAIQCEGSLPSHHEQLHSAQQWLAGTGPDGTAGLSSAAEHGPRALPGLHADERLGYAIAASELHSRALEAATTTAANDAEAVHGVDGSSLQQQQHSEQQHHHQMSSEQLSDGGLWSPDWLHSQDCDEEQWDYGDDGDDDLQQQQQQPSQHQEQPDYDWQQEQQQQQPDNEWMHEQHQEVRQEQQQQQADQQSWQQEQHVQQAEYGWQEFPQLGQLPHGWQQRQGEQGRHPQQQQQQPLQQDVHMQVDPGSVLYDLMHPQQQQGTNTTGPLQQLDTNNQHPSTIAAQHGSGSGSSRAGPFQPAGQSSITGYVTRQPRQQQQQQPNAKAQWQALFKLPKQPLGAHNSAQQGTSAEPRQARLGAQGQLVRAPQQQPPSVEAAAAGAPLQALLQAPGPSLPSWWPAWRRLPGTSIIVDCFGRSCASVGSNRTWVLTHFHADHYMGLGKGFKQGLVICSPITAALVRLKLRVAPEHLVVLQLGQEVQVEGTRLQLIDANHCPGAAMVVAHPPGGAPPVLHTGDARLSPEATRGQAVLQGLVGRAVLVLDTTYADPSYCFPPQQDVLDWVLRAVKAELFNPRCLFLFGTYTIGKERLFLHVAAALQRKVYVAAAKRSILSCLDLPAELSALLTTNHLDANIHAVPMRQVTLEAMESLLLRYKGRYTTVVGFKPTGWSHAGGAGRGAVGHAAAAAGLSRSSLSIKPNRRRSQRGTAVMYQVPYSEHSSCEELRSFVEWFKPIRIIPSVNNDNGPKLRAMMAAVRAKRQVVAGPMDAFARQQQQQPPQQHQQQHPQPPQQQQA